MVLVSKRIMVLMIRITAKSVFFAIRHLFPNIRLLLSRLHGKKIVVFSLPYAMHYDYLAPIFEKLRSTSNMKCYWVIVKSLSSDSRPYLQSRETPRRMILEVPHMYGLRFVDAIISASTLFECFPNCRCERIQVFHGLAGWGSSKSLDPDMQTLKAFNHLFLTGPFQRDMIEDVYFKKYPARTEVTHLYSVGYPKSDNSLDSAKERDRIVTMHGLDAYLPIVLYAPTWEPEASLCSDGDTILPTLAALNVSVIVKVHPNFYKPTFAVYGGEWVDRIKSFCQAHSNCRIASGLNANTYMQAADLMLADVSGVGLEYLLLDKPIVFWDCPAFFEKNGREGAEYQLRYAGPVVQTVGGLRQAIEEQLIDPGQYRVERQRAAAELVYHRGHAAEVAADAVCEILGLKD